MIEKVVYYNDLLEIYGDFLTKKNVQIFRLYYAENLTMQEIADMLKVTKSYVGNSIKKSEEKLDELEAKMQIYNNQNRLNKLLEINDLELIKKEIKNILTK